MNVVYIILVFFSQVLSEIRQLHSALLYEIFKSILLPTKEDNSITPESNAAEFLFVCLF